jgi:hypothetical protein
MIKILNVDSVDIDGKPYPMKLLEAAPDLFNAAITALNLLRGSGFTERTKAIIELRNALIKIDEARFMKK